MASTPETVAAVAAMRAWAVAGEMAGAGVGAGAEDGAGESGGGGGGGVGGGGGGVGDLVLRVLRALLAVSRYQNLCVCPDLRARNCCVHIAWPLLAQEQI